MLSRFSGPRWPIITTCVLLGGACADPPLAPTPGVERPALAQAASSGSGTFIPNSRRYSDKGHPPSTGREGNAALMVRSLVGRDGRAEIYTWAERADAPWTPGVRMQKLQARAFAADGTHLFTRNETDPDSAHTITAAGLQPGSRVQVQAVISGADPRRVGVVTVDDVVRRLPDLAVTQLTVPVRAAVNSAPTLRAVVRETNGDVGAVADCVLEVDGSEVDRVYWMWIDAGGSVTCQFFHIFRAVGQHDVRVRLEPHLLRDWDLANNEATGTIRIDPIASSFYFDASFFDNTFEYYSRQLWRSGASDGSWGYESEYEDAADGRVQDAWMTAYMPQAVRFPLDRIEPRQYTRDGPVQGFVLFDVPADFTWSFGNITESCVRRTFIPEIGGRGWLEICSVQAEATEWEPEWGYTYATYYRNAGDVTYHSRGSSRYWDVGYEDAYSWNFSGSDTFGRFATYGAEYGFFLSLVDRGVLYRANPIVWLAPSESQWSSPWECWSWADDWYRSEGCSEIRSVQRTVSGYVYGEPWAP